MSPSKALPSVYYIKGLPLADGKVFLCKYSAQAFLKAHDLPINRFPIETCEIIYYGSNLTVDMKTTEDLMSERYKGLDTDSQG